MTESGYPYSYGSQRRLTIYDVPNHTRQVAVFEQAGGISWSGREFARRTDPTRTIAARVGKSISRLQSIVLALLKHP